MVVAEAMRRRVVGGTISFRARSRSVRDSDRSLAGVEVVELMEEISLSVGEGSGLLGWGFPLFFFFLSLFWVCGGWVDGLMD